MNVNVKSFNIRVFEKTVAKGDEQVKVDKSEMTYDQMVQLKNKIAEVLDINPINVTAHFEGRE